MPSPRIVVVVLALCLSAAACGSDGSTSSATSTTTTTTTTTTGAAAAVGELSDYCSFSGQANERVLAFDPTSATPAEAEDFYRSMLALAEQGVDAAPGEVADAMAVQRDVLVDTIEVLDAAEWDLVASFDQLSPIYASPEFLAASSTLEEFDIDGCGFPPEDGSVAGDPPPAGEPTEVPAEYVAYCDASFAASQADGLPLSPTPEETEAFYRELRLQIDELRALAPADLRTHLDTLAVNFGEVADILAGVDWDFAAGSPLVQEWAAESADAQMDEAISALETFDEDICGILY